jgi:FkbM family methyltransferase
MLTTDEKGLFTSIKHLLPSTGYFLEVGSRDGRDHCYSLSQKGWGGFCIEANPEIANTTLLNTYKNNPKVKTFNYCVSENTGTTTFYVESTSNSGVSSKFIDRATGADSGINRSVKKTVEVPTITLNDFWDSQNQPELDFLMTDAEGCDASILLATDFSEFRPKVIMSEVTFCYYHIEPILKSNASLVWELLQKHMSEYGYVIEGANDQPAYKAVWCPELLGLPMNAVWRIK